MENAWKLQDAKNCFSAVVKEAMEHGPQKVTRRGLEAVVVISAKDYKRLIKPSTNLVNFFQKSPLYGVELDFKRHKGTARKVDL
ncbi:hypothetical protein MNBD_UNCLBAC01-1839 [hydrothermal vent metagenome]|uniref:Antitoxin n=1 Tax=hydrothermal vent metagenome TaxID=652676 RepID=A0A3B1D223_9ZZZZ